MARPTTDTNQLTQEGGILGTPAYMAPEQARGGPIDHRADLFSLGCVLYRLCTGQTAFDKKDPVATLVAVATNRPPEPTRLNPALPTALSELIMKLLAKDPAHRPQSAHEVITKIQDMEFRFSAQVRRAPRSRWPYFLAASLLLSLITIGPWLVPGIIRIATNKGELVIETDREVQVILKQGGQQVHLFDTRTNRTFSITPGEYEMVIVELPDGVRTKTKSFTLTRGGREVVKASLEITQERGTNLLVPDPNAIVLIDETFKGMTPGNLGGQGGWKGGYIPVHKGMIDTQIVPRDDKGAEVRQWQSVSRLFRNPKNAANFTLTFEAYAYAETTTDHFRSSNHCLGLTYNPNPKVYKEPRFIFWSTSTNATPQWWFDARLLTQELGWTEEEGVHKVTGGFDRWVTLGIRVNRDRGEVIGLYDFGGGCQQTKPFPMSKGDIAAIDAIKFLADYRTLDEFRGIRVKNIRLWATLTNN